MPDIRAMVSDPDFDKLSDEDKRDVLTRAGAKPEFIAELLGGKQASPQPERSFLEKVQAGARQAVQTPIPNAVLDWPTPNVLTGPHIPYYGSSSVEQVLENLPVIGGTVGAVLGGPAGAATLAGGGEAWRQNARRALGLPASTGLVQRVLGLDPDSPEAAVSGMGAEAAVTPVAMGVSKVLGALSKGSSRSSLRFLRDLLQPKKMSDDMNSMELAARMQEEGIAPAFSTRETQIERAQSILDKSSTDLEDKLRPLLAGGATVPTANIKARVTGAVPGVMPTGDIPELGAPGRKAALKAVRDVLKVTGGKSEIPLDTALAEKERLDLELKDVYDRGRLKMPASAKYIKNNADAFRGAVHDKFPEVGTNLLQKSELIDVTRLLKDALEESHKVGGLGTTNQEAAAAGGLFSSKPSLLAILAAKAGMGLGPVASAGSATMSAVSKILEGGAASAQAWLRLADQYNIEQSDEPKPEDRAIQDLAQSLVQQQKPPAGPVSEEEFLRRYQ